MELEDIGISGLLIERGDVEVNGLEFRYMTYAGGDKSLVGDLHWGRVVKVGIGVEVVGVGDWVMFFGNSHVLYAGGRHYYHLPKDVGFVVLVDRSGD